MSEDTAEIKAVLNKHKLTIESKFVPFSKSRNAGGKIPSLNWIVTLKRDGRKVLTTDYSAGMGHAPSYKQSFKRDYDNEQLVKKECESGYACRYMYSLGFVQTIKSKPILPDSLDVIHSLLLDSDALNYSNFEDWAGDFGYEADSRSAEKIYKACLELALQLRNGLGESVLQELQEIFQDY